MNAVAAAASATDRVVYSWPAANDSGSVWLRTVVSACWRSLIVVDVANALAMTSADKTTPMVRIRPGVVHRNHQRGCAGVVGDRDASGSVEGCANSTVTCARTSSFRCSPAIVPTVSPLYKRILRVPAVTCRDSRATRLVGVPVEKLAKTIDSVCERETSGLSRTCQCSVRRFGRHGEPKFRARPPRELTTPEKRRCQQHKEGC